MVVCVSVYLKQNIDFFNFLTVLKKVIRTLKNTYVHVIVDCIFLIYNGLRYMNVFNRLFSGKVLNDFIIFTMNTSMCKEVHIVWCF